MKKSILLMLFALCLSWVSNGQTAIKGFVLTDNNEAVIGANVYAKQIPGEVFVGTISSIDGSFELVMPSYTDTLIISSIGYTSVTIALNGQTDLSIVLYEESTQLDEIVVVGYGIQKKRVSTGSISKLTAENIKGYQVQNVQSALEGQVSGLIVNEGSGQPGSSKSILIRGISTNGDNTPLYVVDGLQVSGIDNINPEDVESIDVLKDAASAAIYGARAANGVIIITTKKGGDGIGKISYEGYMSTSKPWQLPNMLSADEYIGITREKFANGNQLSALNSLGFPNQGDVTPNTNWMDQIFGSGSIKSHRLTASANNSYMSFEYWDEEGVIGGEKSSYERYALRINSNKEINSLITLGQNLYINRVDNQGIGINDAFGTVIADAFAYDPITEVFNENKQYGFEQSAWVQKEYINPLSRLFLSDNDGHSDQIVGNVYADIKITDEIKFHSDFGMDYSWWKWRNFTPDYRFHSAFVNVSNDVSQGFGFGQTYQFENYLNYSKRIDEHNFDVVLGTSYRENQFEQAGGSSSFIPDEVKFNDNWQNIDAGQDSTDLAFGSIGVDYKLISYYGRLLYNYDSKYLFTATLRRDGSSNFGQANRFGIFPSFSVGWVMSDEDFFNLGSVSFLKLRASWGVNGNDRIQPLAFASTIENVFTYPFGQEQTLNTGASLATPPNPNIRWEESVQIDLGVEFRLWNDKLTGELDVYKKNTKDLLMAQVIPGYIGATNNPISNLGEIENKGIELGLTFKHSIGDFRFRSSINYTTFKNTVVSVAGDSGFINGWSWPVRNTSITRMTEGFPVAHFVGYQTDGIFQSKEEVFSYINNEGDVYQPKADAGDLRFVDANGDGQINSDDITNIGNPWPDHIIGLSLGFDYKGFDFSAVFSTQIGHDIFRAYERSDITYSNYQRFWLDRWTPENPGNEIPRLVSNDPNNNQRPSDFYVEDGTFLRLRNLQIGYNLPDRLLDKINLTGLRVYLSGNNLFTVTNYNGFDPEIGSGNWILDTGIDKGFYPSNKTIGFGLKVTM